MSVWEIVFWCVGITAVLEVAFIAFGRWYVGMFVGKPRKCVKKD